MEYTWRSLGRNWDPSHRYDSLLSYPREVQIKNKKPWLELSSSKKFTVVSEQTSPEYGKESIHSLAIQGL